MACPGYFVVEARAVHLGKSCLCLQLSHATSPSALMSKSSTP
jgi:hypothetical protein